LFNGALFKGALVDAGPALALGFDWIGFFVSTAFLAALAGATFFVGKDGFAFFFAGAGTFEARPFFADFAVPLLAAFVLFEPAGRAPRGFAARAAFPDFPRAADRWLATFPVFSTMRAPRLDDVGDGEARFPHHQRDPPAGHTAAAYICRHRASRRLTG